jgi:hypothetical protein
MAYITMTCWERDLVRLVGDDEDAYEITGSGSDGTVDVEIQDGHYEALDREAVKGGAPFYGRVIHDGQEAGETVFCTDGEQAFMAEFDGNGQGDPVVPFDPMTGRVSGEQLNRAAEFARSWKRTLTKLGNGPSQES